MKPYFMDITAKIIAEVRARTCIDIIDTEVLEEILQYELNEYYYELDEYYINDVYNEVSRAHRTSYDDGYDTGYDDGYTAGYESSLGEAVERAYYEGYDEGYYEGYDEGRSEVEHE